MLLIIISTFIINTLKTARILYNEERERETYFGLVSKYLHLFIVVQTKTKSDGEGGRGRLTILASSLVYDRRVSFIVLSLPLSPRIFF